MKELPLILLEQKSHRKVHQLLVKFKYNENLINLIRKIPNVNWSSSLKSWYIKDTLDNLNLILNTFKNKATIDQSKLSRKNAFKRNLTDEQRKLLNNFHLYLKGKRYSRSTIQTYTFFIADFVNFYTKVSLENLTNRTELFY